MKDRTRTSRAVILIDHNIEGQAVRLWDTLNNEGWLELYSVEIVMFTDVGLPFDINDRSLWRFVQQHQMLLLTVNRNMADEDSPEQTLREENRSSSLPVITIGNPARIEERVYRERCAEK